MRLFGVVFKRHLAVIFKLNFPYRKQYELFDQVDQRERREKINVESFREKMSRARLLDNTPEYPIMRRLDKNTMPAAAASKQPRRRHSLVLPDELAVVGKKVAVPKGPEITVDPSPNQKRRLPLVLQKGKNSMTSEVNEANNFEVISKLYF